MHRSIGTGILAPDVAIERLRAGNARFVAGEQQAFRNWHPELPEPPFPFAVFLGCSDARAPAEYVFDQDLGDLFVIRVAGNIVAPSLVGSVEFACDTYGTRLVVVMGHTNCGAVAATVRAIEDEGGTPRSSNLQSIVARITPHVAHLFDGPLKGDALMEAAIRANALASARDLQSSSAVLRGHVDDGRVKIVAALYDLATGVVSFLEVDP